GPAGERAAGKGGCGGGATGAHPSHTLSLLVLTPFHSRSLLVLTPFHSRSLLVLTPFHSLSLLVLTPLIPSPFGRGETRVRLSFPLSALRRGGQGVRTTRGGQGVRTTRGGTGGEDHER